MQPQVLALLAMLCGCDGEMLYSLLLVGYDHLVLDVIVPLGGWLMSSGRFPRKALCSEWRHGRPLRCPFCCWRECEYRAAWVTYRLMCNANGKCVTVMAAMDTWKRVGTPVYIVVSTKHVEVVSRCDTGAACVAVGMEVIPTSSYIIGKVCLSWSSACRCNVVVGGVITVAVDGVRLR